MRVIDKIKIRYFRSIKEQTLSKISEVNIFSGANDSGKSNVLKALNLFFNEQTNFQQKLIFDEEFSKERLDDVRKKSIKGRQIIAIKIFFCAPSGHKNLPKKFCFEKVWDRDGNLLSISENVLSQFKQGKTNAKTEKAAKQALSRFINSIHYEYVPAVRSPKIFENLLSLLQELILKKNKKNTNINKLLEKINDESKDFTSRISNDFEKISRIKSGIRIPTEFQDFFKSFFIDTESGQFSIPLKLRGDGIQMRYIPTILDYIAKNSRGIFIWGFDEPENSTEYTLCNQMAKDFRDIFAKNSQIFVSTHSFHFTTLHGENVSKYRVYKDKQNVNSLITLIKDDSQLNLFNTSDAQKINEELGIIELHKAIANEYKEWQDKRDEWLSNFNKLEEQIKNDGRLPIVFVEGITDKKILDTAWTKLYGNKTMPFKVVNGFSCSYIRNMFTREDILSTSSSSSNRFIGMLDFDDAYAEYLTLQGGKSKNGNYKEIKADKEKGLTIKHTKKHIYLFLLPVPNTRKNYADSTFSKSYLTIELLFADKLLKSYTEEIIEAGNVKFIKMKDSKKIAFAEKVKTFDEKDFSNFKPIFDLIEELIK